MRPKTPIMLIAALLAVVAATTAPAAGSGDASVRSRFATARVSAWAERAHRAEHPRAPHGPFVPPVGPGGEGTAENAFGAARTGHVHAGQDMFAKPGTPEIAVSDGIVAETGSDGGQGNYVYLYDPKVHRTYVYMHMIEPAQVHAGERVHAGQE